MRGAINKRADAMSYRPKMAANSRESKEPANEHEGGGPPVRHRPECHPVTQSISK